VRPTAPPATATLQAAASPTLTIIPPTPVPPTASPTPVPPTETPAPTADAAATAAAVETATAAPIIAMIDAELQQYGFSTEQGRLGWLHEPLTLETHEYMEDNIYTDYPDLKVSDFVVHADVTWNTTSGLAACGFAVRADPDFDYGDSYRVYLVRLGPLWDIEYYKMGDFYANVSGLRDALPLDDGLDSTNHITVIGRGSEFGVYANGQEHDTVADSRLTEGTVAFIASQESGKTICTFENAWLWVLDGE
jgi:hypothetical protein